MNRNRKNESRKNKVRNAPGRLGERKKKEETTYLPIHRWLFYFTHTHTTLACFSFYTSVNFMN